MISAGLASGPLAAALVANSGPIAAITTGPSRAPPTAIRLQTAVTPPPIHSSRRAGHERISIISRPQ